MTPIAEITEFLQSVVRAMGLALTPRVEQTADGWLAEVIVDI